MGLLDGTAKFDGEQDASLHGGKLHWPGVNGIPFRGSTAPLLKKHELEKIPIIGDAKHRVFDLSDPEQSDAYERIRDHMRNGMFVQDFIHREWDPVKRNMVVYLEWTQLYRQLPASAVRSTGGLGHGSPQQFTIRGDY